ncbi:hypothetical protein GM415_12725 [Pseudodesulfovibrio cashew]|uniref:Uncharacterized protein n=1 Tax=Pseudodesulfovibrio cashew TaxID=2678688 RepID=A0A6I6JTG8_9BACT|nr:hypothetical protein [Pseudodesulfovibrio cashew]QGY40954.1 hypothetical protein GM415_12725 [Pseudodesulfovibrio cashew]
MITLFLILLVSAVLLFLAINKISAQRVREVNALDSQKRSMEHRLEFMLKQRKELRKELEDKERKLSTLKNSQDGIKTVSAGDLGIEDENEDQKVSRYLLQEGKISLEQNEKVMQKMSVLKMDFLGSCLALGYIDLKTAQKAMKVNKIKSKATGLND